MNSEKHRQSTITAILVPEAERVNITARLFGTYFPLRLEPAIYAFAQHLCMDYHGGYWHFYTLSNGGFYLAPEGNYRVSSENGYSGTMSADAFGITVCLYAYSHLSFSKDRALAELCARHFHLLRDFALEHAEVRSILAAVDRAEQSQQILTSHEIVVETYCIAHSLLNQIAEKEKSPCRMKIF